ncbi:Malto-oligosyltrehalose trehalohydrolase [Rubrobacter xylanophilus DSM 9941]|uniref:malto-oligosyltrehalose trehalohydrolase n=1 Tax=Rubrobacter xylanophilus TaxID=49319 RepID=UPI001C63F244|nr:malto-oligosyltrehalose trehalohydrolase [Rubrobacter xylanophilus]QYJ16552.1 Malto-oligosyltrehalose trehalohydrolase [Rubrobacter xylanophilus DSM 9941]
MIRRHHLPFGAEYLGGGRTRFTLWAPAAGGVELVLEGGARRMERGENGLFTLVAEAPPGTRYRYRMEDGTEVPDPASRFQPEDVHGPSAVVDPACFEWGDEGWRGRPWHEAVVYELHVGTFSPEGTYEGVAERLDHLVELGVTAVELMPLADFPGLRGWGYDGVLPYAPDSSYGTPEGLKGLVQAAHERNLMVFLDVVYNHFGPQGNYLPLYAPQFFTPEHETPWGDAVDFGREMVREFFLHNALYWLEEYHLDGLRLDAVHAIFDDPERHFVRELARRVREGPGRDRHVHLVLENDANAASLLRDGAAAQWSDDLHHALHVALTGEDSGYYADYAPSPVRHLGRALAEGFAYQGEPSQHRGGERRGEPSADLPPTSFVAFLQNHDQVGNRAFGERITALAPPKAVRAAAEIYLLSPQIPLLFMGEEWAASAPFLFFCDFGGELARAVAAGRREEFAAFPEFSDPATRERIPDPNAPGTFEASRLDWGEREAPEHAAWVELYRTLLSVRRERIVPLLSGTPGSTAWRTVGGRGLETRWNLAGGARLALRANLGPGPLGGFGSPEGELLYATEGAQDAERELPGWSVVWHLAEGAA